MSITDGLREWTRNHTVNCSDNRIALVAIADRIDAAHRSALEKLAAQIDRAEPDRAEPEKGVSWKEEARTWERRCKELIVERDERYIALPVDADGVPIHVGDKLTDTEHQSIGLGPTEVRCILYNDEGCVVSANDPHGYWYDPSLLRHHHAPTVEDVLREFADRVCSSGHQWGLDAADTIAEFAARLRLAGDAE